MKRRVRPPSISKILATQEVAWKPSSRLPNRCIKLTCCAAVPTLRAQREPVAGLADQQSIAIQIP